MLTQATEIARATRTRDDRILPVTRLTSAIIVPFLVAAFVILYVFPDHTQELFAWGIKPRMSAMMLGAAYIGGAYFFIRAATNARWHWVKVGFLPVTTFATLMGIATILHWDRFNHGYISFFAWVGLYFTTPFIVFLLWLRNRSTDPGPTNASESLRVPYLVRLVIGIVGGVTLLTSIVLFLEPGFMISTWPWQLTPLTARLMGALFALTGVGELAIALDVRWSAVRIPLQSQMIGIVLIVLAMVFSWSNFQQANPLTWIFLASIIFLLVASPLLYVWMETRGKVRDRTAE
ncbi:MAG: hypothetical protein M3Z24_13885 [Chloroflexota bacterium]|nr:hypothetical protein [Chloroflexota bacterium]